MACRSRNFIPRSVSAPLEDRDVLNNLSETSFSQLTIPHQRATRLTLKRYGQDGGKINRKPETRARSVNVDADVEVSVLQHKAEVKQLFKPGKLDFTSEKRRLHKKKNDQLVKRGLVQGLRVEQRKTWSPPHISEGKLVTDGSPNRNRRISRGPSASSVVLGLGRERSEMDGAPSPKKAQGALFGPTESASAFGAIPSDDDEENPFLRDDEIEEKLRASPRLNGAPYHDGPYRSPQELRHEQERRKREVRHRKRTQEQELRASQPPGSFFTETSIGDAPGIMASDATDGEDETPRPVVSMNRRRRSTVVLSHVDKILEKSRQNIAAQEEAVDLAVKAAELGVGLPFVSNGVNDFTRPDVRRKIKDQLHQTAVLMGEGQETEEELQRKADEEDRKKRWVILTELEKRRPVVKMTRELTEKTHATLGNDLGVRPEELTEMASFYVAMSKRRRVDEADQIEKLLKRWDQRKTNFSNLEEPLETKKTNDGSSAFEVGAVLLQEHSHYKDPEESSVKSTGGDHEDSGPTSPVIAKVKSRRLVSSIKPGHQSMAPSPTRQTAKNPPRDSKFSSPSTSRRKSPNRGDRSIIKTSSSSASPATPGSPRIEQTPQTPQTAPHAVPVIAFEDYTLIIRCYQRFAVGGYLRVLQMPRGGYPFSEKVLDGPVARRLDRTHSGNLELIDVMQFLFPALSLHQIEVQLEKHEKLYHQLLSRGMSLPSLDRLSVDTINDYARVFQRGDPVMSGKMNMTSFVALAGGPESLVRDEDLRQMFVENAKYEPPVPGRSSPNDHPVFPEGDGGGRVVTPGMIKKAASTTKAVQSAAHNFTSLLRGGPKKKAAAVPFSGAASVDTTPSSKQLTLTPTAMKSASNNLRPDSRGTQGHRTPSSKHLKTPTLRGKSPNTSPSLQPAPNPLPPPIVGFSPANFSPANTQCPTGSRRRSTLFESLLSKDMSTNANSASGNPETSLSGAPTITGGGGQQHHADHAQFLTAGNSVLLPQVRTPHASNKAQRRSPPPGVEPLLPSLLRNSSNLSSYASPVFSHASSPIAVRGPNQTKPNPLFMDESDRTNDSIDSTQSNNLSRSDYPLGTPRKDKDMGPSSQTPTSSSSYSKQRGSTILNEIMRTCHGKQHSGIVEGAPNRAKLEQHGFLDLESFITAIHVFPLPSPRRMQATVGLDGTQAGKKMLATSKGAALALGGGKPKIGDDFVPTVNIPRAGGGPTATQSTVSMLREKRSQDEAVLYDAMKGMHGQPPPREPPGGAPKLLEQLLAQVPTFKTTKVVTNDRLIQGDPNLFTEKRVV